MRAPLAALDGELPRVASLHVSQRTGSRAAGEPSAGVPAHLDVAVSGGGMSGLVAACAAAQTGARVALFEKGSRLGGSMRLSNGFLVTFTTARELHDAVPEGDAPLQAVVVEGFAGACEWLGQLGVPMVPRRRAVGGRSGYQVDPNEVVATLERRLLMHGGSIHLEQALRAWNRDGTGGDATCVALAHDGSTTTVSTVSLVLATGGFQGNAELVARLCRIATAGAYHRANAWSTGDGLLCALDAGAAMSRSVDGFYGHAMAAEPATVNDRTFAALTQYQGNLCVALNADGCRFADESAGLGEEELNQQLARQPGQLGWYIGDEEIASFDAPRGSGTTVRVILERTERLGGIVHRAPTFRELCEALAATGLHATAALETLRDFRQAMREGTHPRAVQRSNNRLRFDRPPYWAVKVRPGITFTTGGIAVDTSMRVIDRVTSSSPLARHVTDPSDYRPSVLAGLYACGADVGGVSGRSYAGGLATALVTGRLAGQAAAHGALGPLGAAVP